MWRDLGAYGMFPDIDVNLFREDMDRSARFTPVLRFILADEAKRPFYVERWCYLGSIDDWVNIGAAGQLSRWVKQTVPKLGSDAFFELMWLSG